MSTTATRVRACGAEDLPTVLELWAGARSRHAVSEDRLEDLERLLARSPGALLLAEIEGRACGALIAASDGWRGNIYRLAVLPEHRRRGVGEALVRAGEAHLRREGIFRVTALVGFDDQQAGAFWDSVGYPQDPDIGRRVRTLPGDGRA